MNNFQAENKNETFFSNFKKTSKLKENSTIAAPHTLLYAAEQSGGNKEKNEQSILEAANTNLFIPKNRYFKKKFLKGYSKVHELKLVSIGLASPEKIQSWAEKELPNGKIFGEVTNANTLHYRTFLPTKGGLFCERIFGPLKDFECACGKRQKPTAFESKKILEHRQTTRYFCANCDVEYTWSIIRRYQLGYIKLNAPVTHLWYLKTNPSYLSIFFDMKRKDLESVIYCMDSLTLENMWKLADQKASFYHPITDLYKIWQNTSLNLQKNNVEKSFEIKKQTKRRVRKKFVETLNESIGLLLDPIRSAAGVEAVGELVGEKKLTKFQKNWQFLNTTSFSKKDAGSVPDSTSYRGADEKFSFPVSELPSSLPEDKESLTNKKQTRFAILNSNFHFLHLVQKRKNEVFSFQNPIQTKIFENVFEKKQQKVLFFVFEESLQKVFQKMYGNQTFESLFNEKFLNQNSNFGFFSFFQKSLFSKKFENQNLWISFFFIFKFSILFTFQKKKKQNNTFQSSLFEKENGHRKKVENKKILLFLFMLVPFLKKFEYTKTLIVPKQKFKKFSSFYRLGKALTDQKNFYLFRAFVKNQKKYFQFDFAPHRQSAGWTNRKFWPPPLCKAGQGRENFQTFFSVESLSRILFNFEKRKKSFSSLSRFIPILLAAGVESRAEQKNRDFAFSLFKEGCENPSEKFGPLRGKQKTFSEKKRLKIEVFNLSNGLKRERLEKNKQQKLEEFQKFLNYDSSFKIFDTISSDFSLFKIKTTIYENKNKSTQKVERSKFFKNPVSTLSYNFLWKNDSDWNYFIYYNAFVFSEFKDIPIFYFSSREVFCSLSTNFFSPPFTPPIVGPGMKSNFSPRNGQSSLFDQRNKPGIQEIMSFQASQKRVSVGAGILEKFLIEYTPTELKKMIQQHQILLPKINQAIRFLKQPTSKKESAASRTKIQKYLQKREHIIRRLKFLRKFYRRNSNPTFMILRTLPVLPPDLRPILKLQNQIAASDLNRFYQRILYRNERLKKFSKDSVTHQSFEMRYAQRLLQEAVDNLIQNGKGGVKPETNSRGQPLKSLSEILKGKQGRFRQYLLGKRVDYSGRSVIVVGPKLKLYECGLPKEMAIELFLPFLIQQILQLNLTKTVIGAKNLLKKDTDLAFHLLNKIIKNIPILLNRAPTLHRLGFQAFLPKLVEGRAILLHPMVCPGFNADFDGDQMAVHIPLTVEARTEAWKFMLSTNNFINSATGEPILLPTQDMVLGCYYLTTDFQSKGSAFQILDSFRKSSTTNFSNFQSLNKSFLFFQNILEVFSAYSRQEIGLHTPIWIRWNGFVDFGKNLTKPVEIQLRKNGSWNQIHPKFTTFYTQKNEIFSQFIRTTPGRILMNVMIRDFEKPKT